MGWGGVDREEAVLCPEAAVWRWQHRRGGWPHAVAEEGRQRCRGMTVVHGGGGGAPVDDGHAWWWP
jgi:hypothetical protein